MSCPREMSGSRGDAEIEVELRDSLALCSFTRDPLLDLVERLRGIGLASGSSSKYISTNFSTGDFL